MFAVVAADHRDSMRALIDPESPQSMVARQLIDICGTARQRLAELTQIALEFGVPWSTRYSKPQVDEHWFRGY
jgi:hypothetical protein